MHVGSLRIALIGTIAMPLAFVLLAAVLDRVFPETLLPRSESPHPNVSSYANMLLQVFFAKHVGVSILTMPLLVYVTHATAGPVALPWWRGGQGYLYGKPAPLAEMLLIRPESEQPSSWPH